MYYCPLSNNLPADMHKDDFHSFIHVFTSTYPLTGASQGCGDSHNIIHNMSVELQTS
jgi:hypothetical protein